MSAQTVAVLDFGSSKLSVFVGERGVNNTLNIKGSGECDYSGYYKGVFIEPDKLGFAIAHAINIAEAGSGIKIKKLFVGVPADFSACITKETGISFAKKQTISDNEIQMLFRQGNDFGDIDDHIITDISPVYFILDDDRRLLNPRGIPTTRLGGFLSYILASEQFYKPLTEVFSNLDISVHYTSAALAKVLYLFDQKQREASVMLFDIGASASSVIMAKGNGILSLYNFALGGNSITDELSEFFDISPSVAESLKRKAILTLRHLESDTYEIECRDEILAFPSIVVDEIVCDRINAIGYMLAKCLNICEFVYPEYNKFFLSGGGIAYIKGAKDMLSKQLSRAIEIVLPSQPQMEKPHLSSGLSLINTAIDIENKQNKNGFFYRLSEKLKFFGRK